MPCHHPQFTDKETEGDKVKQISQGQAGSDKAEIWELGTELSLIETWR